jgi:hypothetical protein
MLVSRHGFLATVVVAAILVGVLVHGGLGDLDGGGASGGEQSAAAVVAEWSPVAVVPVTLRDRAWADGELVSAVRFLKGQLAGLAPTGVAGLAASAVAWWCLARPDRRLDVPLRCSSLAALRAPPALL